MIRCNICEVMRRRRGRSAAHLLVCKLPAHCVPSQGPARGAGRIVSHGAEEKVAAVHRLGAHYGVIVGGQACGTANTAALIKPSGPPARCALGEPGSKWNLRQFAGRRYERPTRRGREGGRLVGQLAVIELQRPLQEVKQVSIVRCCAHVLTSWRAFTE